MSTTPQKTSTQQVLDAVQDLHAQEQIVTRETLAQVTGLKLTVIDDRLGVLVDDGKIQRVQRGVFVPAVVHPPARAMSKTLMPDGMVKLEIGDEVFMLTPREDRMLAGLQAGAAAQFASIELGHQAMRLNTELADQVRRLSREVAALKERQDPNQRSLLEA